MPSKFTVFHKVEPANEWEALMQTIPHQEPETNLDDTFLIREDIANAICQLSEQQQRIFEGLFIERATQSELASELGVARATICRERDRAIVRLQEILSKKGYCQ